MSTSISLYSLLLAISNFPKAPVSLMGIYVRQNYDHALYLAVCWDLLDILLLTEENERVFEELTKAISYYRHEENQPLANVYLCVRARVRARACVRVCE